MKNWKKIITAFLFTLLIGIPVNAVMAEGQEEEVELVNIENMEDVVETEETSIEEVTKSRTTTSTTFSSSSFIDVPNDHWAFREIMFLNELSVIQGYQLNDLQYDFRPNNKVSRAQAAKMIVSALGYEELQVSNPTFRDVPADHWAIGWIEQAIRLNVFTGYDDGTFKPQALLSRAQMSKIIDQAFPLSVSAASGQPNPFHDVKSTHWALNHVKILYYNGISNGSNGRFLPEQDINRAQFSAFLSRAINDDFKVEVLPVLGEYKTVAKVTVGPSLNIRQAPNTTSTVIGRLLPGDVTPAYEINGNWVKVFHQNQVGYIHKTYVKLINIDGNPLKDRIIVLDAGHGGKDPGAVANSARESDVVFAVTRLVEGKLRKAGANVILTRDTDKYLTLAERVEFSKKNYAELFVSIHANAASTTAAKGSEVFYNKSANVNHVESASLAKLIQSEIVTGANMRDRGTKTGEFFVIKNQNIPSVLIELGFISNSEDAAKLKSPEYQEKFAEAIYRGILNYYK